MLGEPENRFSLRRAALSAGGRAKSKIQAHLWWILITLAVPAVSGHATAAEARSAVASAGAVATSIAATDEARVVRFPADRSVGTLVDLDRPRDNKGHLPDWWMWNGYPKSPALEIAAARGEVRVHAGQRVGLIVTPHGPDDDLQALRNLPSGSVELLAFNTKGPPPGDACVASRNAARMWGLSAVQPLK